jgi:extradiol dioxygenase family protein
VPIDWGDHECLYFLDPDGNLLELVGYREPTPGA